METFICDHCGCKTIMREPNIIGNSEDPIMICNTCYDYYNEPEKFGVNPHKKEETIEKAAEIYISKLNLDSFRDNYFIKDLKLAIEFGANWQKEQSNITFEEGYKACEKHYKDLKAKMYTEEEVKKLCQYAMEYAQDQRDYPFMFIDKWFENNKKK